MRENRTSIQARRAYAELLRRFIAGRLTNDEYEDGLGEIFEKHGRDRACQDIFAAVWHLYDDCSVHRMDGRHTVTPDLRRKIGAWIVFLKTDLEYIPPTYDRSLRPKRTPQRASVPVRIIASLASLTAFAAPATLGHPPSVWIPMGFFATIICVILVAVAEIGGRGLSLDDAVFQAAFVSECKSGWPFASAEQRAAVIARPRGLGGVSMNTLSS